MAGTGDSPFGEPQTEKVCLVCVRACVRVCVGKHVRGHGAMEMIELVHFTRGSTTQERLQQRLRVLDLQPASPELPSAESSWPRIGNYRTYKKAGLLG